MSQHSNNTSSSGIGFTGMLAILFIGLKLGRIINWSWWWVLSPMWIGLLVALGLLMIAALIYGLFEVTQKVREKRRENR